MKAARDTWANPVVALTLCAAAGALFAWLKTPLPGVIWCNCPHMTGYDGTSVEDLTAADADGRGRIEALTYRRWLKQALSVIALLLLAQYAYVTWFKA